MSDSHVRTYIQTEKTKTSVDSYGLVSPKARQAAILAALDTRVMPPQAHYFLILACLKCDETGRTKYGPAQHERATGDPNGQHAIDWLAAHGMIRDALTDAGVECWQLTHLDWSTLTGPATPTPPPIADVLEPSGPKYHPPAGTSWRELAQEDS